VPLLATITVVELLGEARSDCSRQFRCLEPYTMVGVIFLAISIPSSLLVRFVERRIAYARA
jgi:polar amino acid transport system permease protein